MFTYLLKALLRRLIPPDMRYTYRKVVSTRCECSQCAEIRMALSVSRSSSEEEADLLLSRLRPSNPPPVVH